MADFPAINQLPPGPTIAMQSMWAFGGTAVGFSIATPTSAVWPSANLGIFVPITLPGPFVVRAGWTRNGSAVAGNMDIGVFGLDGTLIVSTGSTAQSGTSTFQIVSMGPTLLPPGGYYMALSASSASAQFVRNTYTAGTGLRYAGVLQAASQVPLANLPTFAAPANDYLPVFGIASVTTI